MVLVIFIYFGWSEPYECVEEGTEPKTQRNMLLPSMKRLLWLPEMDHLSRYSIIVYKYLCMYIAEDPITGGPKMRIKIRVELLQQKKLAATYVSLHLRP